MEIAIGVIVYLVLLVLFGRFLHECDERLPRTPSEGGGKRAEIGTGHTIHTKGR